MDVQQSLVEACQAIRNAEALEAQAADLEVQRKAHQTTFLRAVGTGRAQSVQPIMELERLVQEIKICSNEATRWRDVAMQHCDDILAVDPRQEDALRLRLALSRQRGENTQALALIADVAAAHTTDATIQNIYIGALSEEIHVALSRVLAQTRKPDWAVSLLGWLAQMNPAAARTNTTLTMRALVVPQTGAQQRIIADALLACSSGERDSNLVVFVSESPRTRELKLARGLIKRGKSVVLIYGKTPIYSVDDNFSASFKYNDHWDALSIASSLRPLVFHLFSLFSEPLSVVFTRYKPGVVVFDYCDIFPAMILRQNQDLQCKWQTEIFDKADGVCCRDLQYAAAVRKNGWRRNRHVLWFPEYLDERLAVLPHTENRRVHAVSLGNIHDPDGHLTFSARAIRPLVERGIHVTHFPHGSFASRPWNDTLQLHAELLDVGKDNGLVALHPIVSPDELMRLLPQFDIGLLLPNDPRTYRPECLAACMASRAHEYLQAGLAVAVWGPLRLQKFLIGRYGEQFDLDAAAASSDLQWIRDAARRAKGRRSSAETYTMDANAERLEQFYATLAHEQAQTRAAS